MVCTAVAIHGLILAPGSARSADAEPFERPEFRADRWIVELSRDHGVEERGNLPLPGEPAPMTSSTAWRGPVGRPSQGSMQGRLIFLQGGHGRTYMEEDFDWLTQRGPMNGLVEDYGNQDQASIFSEVALRSGATVIPLRPLHHQPNERIAHIQSPGTRLFGKWNGVRDSRTYQKSAGSRAVAAWSRVERQETAVICYRPFFAKAGHYPVYVWAPSGPDRARATYRVVHAGGADEIMVNHRMVGHGWIYLGRYFFDRGWGQGLDLTNKAVDPLDADLGRIVVADTVRFGNGLGHAVRPGGISNHTREDEATVYWLQDSAGAQADRRLHTVGMDRNNTVGSPPRFSAYMNREVEGRFSDRVYMSFHSNASGARGALGLWARDPAQRPDFQEQLADLTGRRVNVGLLEESLGGLPSWARRTRHQLNHITFGELRKDYIQGEMSSTILETAFFDQPDDARWLTDPRGQLLFAQATLAALIEWFQLQERPGQPYVLPPPAPEEPTVVMSDLGVLNIRFVPGRTGPVRGHVATQYHAEISRDGRSFGPALSLGSASPTTMTLPIDWSTTSPVFVRLRASNSAGYGMASPVVASMLRAGKPSAQLKRLLLVDASLTMDSSQNMLQTEQFGRAVENFRTVQRVRPLALLDSERTVRLGETLGALQVPFDMASPADLAASRVDLSLYQAVIYDSGTALSDFQPMPTAVAQSLARYVEKGGKVLGFGSSLAQSLSQDGADGADLLKTAFAAQRLARSVDYATAVLEPSQQQSWSLDQEGLNLPVPMPADSLVPTNSGREVLRWSVHGGGAAAVAGPGGVVTAVSLASLRQSEDRLSLLRYLFTSVGLNP